MLCRKCKKEIPDESAFCLHCGVKQDKPKRAARKRGAGGTVYKRGKTYTARVTTYKGGRRSISKGGFVKKQDAEAYLPALYQQLQNAKKYDHLKTISFCDLYTAWSDKKYNGQLGRLIGKSTVMAYKIAYKRCEPLYSYVDFRDIHYAEMQEVIDSLVSYDTQKDVKEMLNQMSQFAMKNEWCEKNYASLLDLTNYKAPQKDAFTEEEVAALWRDYLGIDKEGHKTEKHSFTGFILIMIHCGLRYGELSSILKENVYMDKHYMMGGIKSDLSRKSPIAISEEILPVIQEKYNAGDTKLLHMNEDNFYAAYYEACKRAGVRELNPHCCRHTYITRQTRAGVPPAIIQKSARHTSYKTTLGYTHMQIDDVLQALNSLPPVIPNAESDSAHITHNSEESPDN